MQQETENTEYAETDSAESAINNLGSILAQEFAVAEIARRPYEQRWVDSLRGHRGQYSADVIAKIEPGRSVAFLNLIRVKCRAMDARLLDMLFPGGGEDNWNIEPTPDPELAPEAVSEIKRELVLGAKKMADETGSTVPLSNEMVKEVEVERAREAAKKMKVVIKDGLKEGRYRRVSRRVAKSGNIFGTGILKGPLMQYGSEYRYTATAPGQFEGKHTPIDKPWFGDVRIWDCYPDMTATTKEELEYVYERSVVNRSQLRKLAKREDFKGDIIQEVIRSNPDGDASRKPWETDVQALNDSMASVPSTYRKKWELLERWGYIDGADLINAGVELPEGSDDLEYMANVWILGGQVIKAQLSPYESGVMPYNLYYFEEDENSIFGIGIPEIVEDIQELANSANRVMLDNAAASAGPQIEANLGLLHDSEIKTIRQFKPFRVTLRKGIAMEKNAKAISYTNIPNNVEQNKKLVLFYKEFLDEVSSIPAYMHGENETQGAGGTMGGLSMLMGAANLAIKDVLANFDEGIIKPFISAMYEFHMVYSKDPSIKGDFHVSAEGTSSMVAKEVRAQSLLNFTKTYGQSPYIDQGRLVREAIKSQELPEGLAYSEEDMDKITDMEKQMAQMTQMLTVYIQTYGQLQPEQVQQVQGQPQPEQIGG